MQGFWFCHLQSGVFAAAKALNAPHPKPLPQREGLQLRIIFSHLCPPFGAVMLSSTFDSTTVRGLRPLTGSFDPNSGR
jgi:hypothetical protein